MPHCTFDPSTWNAKRKPALQGQVTDYRPFTDHRKRLMAHGSWLLGKSNQRISDFPIQHVNEPPINDFQITSPSPFTDHRSFTDHQPFTSPSPALHQPFTSPSPALHQPFSTIWFWGIQVSNGRRERTRMEGAPFKCIPPHESPDRGGKRRAGVVDHAPGRSHAPRSRGSHLEAP